MAKSKIEWTDRSWNPVSGCSKRSQGCKNCYAERMYERFNGHGSFKNVIMHPERLEQPLHWKISSKVFVNSMSDLFHEDVPDSFINEVFKIMKQTPQHTYQILTKRPERMFHFITESDDNCNRNIALPNVWLGVSVEDQATANERIPLLLQVPAAVKFLSCEPLLGPVKLETKWFFPIRKDFENPDTAVMNIRDAFNFNQLEPMPGISWVICGGESGPGARPMNPDWARSIRDHCKAADVSFFFKQWGEYLPVGQMSSDILPNKKSFRQISSTGKFIEVISCYKVGKKAAVNFLDGEQYLEFPKKKNQLIS